MDPLTRLAAVAVPLDLLNVNTDQIFPARFIKKPRGVGYAQFAFHDLRRNRDGSPNPDFALNADRFAGAQILVGNSNFGCGSSREGAVYTLQDTGFRILIAPSFGDIFAANCLKNGVLTIALPDATVATLRDALVAADNPALTVDLESQQILTPDGDTIAFEADPFQRDCLLKGLNEIDLSLAFEAEMTAFETAYRSRFPWLAPADR